MCDFFIQQALERLALRGRQIVSLILVVDGKQPELGFLHAPVIDDAQPAPFALATSGVRTAQLAAVQPAARDRPRHQVSDALPFKRRQFDEQGFHGKSIRLLRIF